MNYQVLSKHENQLAGYNATVFDRGRFWTLDWSWFSGLSAIAFLGVLLYAYPLALGISSISINGNEGWNALRAARAAVAMPLFAAPPLYEMTNYPPLSFHLIGWLSHLTGGHVLGIGRFISLVSLASISVLLAAISRALGASRGAAFYAALLFPVWLAGFMPDRICMDDPQLLGMALSLLGAYAYLRSPTSRSWLVLSALCFASSEFTKQTLLAFPIAVLALMIWRRHWASAMIWLISGAFASVLLLGATLLLDGPYFFTHLLWPRALSLHEGLKHIAFFAFTFSVAIAASLAWLLCTRRRTAQAFLLPAWLTAHLLAVPLALGDGVFQNIFFECLEVDALVVSLFFTEVALLNDYWGADWRLKAVFTIALTIPVFSALPLAPNQVLENLRSWPLLRSQQAEAAHGVALLREISQPVVCEDLLLCVNARQESFFDPFFVNDQVLAGRLNECTILNMVADRRFGAIEINQSPGEGSPLEPGPRRYFSERFMHVLQASYRPALVTSRFTVFLPENAGVERVRSAGLAPGC